MIMPAKLTNLYNPLKDSNSFIAKEAVAVIRKEDNTTMNLK
jgi:hypothetical protein